MVGDKGSDIEFGKAVSMTTVFLSETPSVRENADYNFTSLGEFALFLQENA